MIRFNENKSKVLISKLEIESVSGTVKLAKRFRILTTLSMILILPDFYKMLQFKCINSIKSIIFT